MTDPAPRLVVVDDDVADDHRPPDPVAWLRRRFDGGYHLDPWGLDDDVTRLAGRLAALRWSVTVLGLGNLPAEGPALLVANRRMGWSEPVVVASAVLERTGRFVRPVGGIDLDPVGGVLRRLGALPARAPEVASALRAGELVLVPTRREPVRNRPGHLPVELLATAVTVGVPLVPVAVIGWEFGRHWTVRVGEPVTFAAEHGDRRGGRRGDGHDTRDDARIVGAAAVDVSLALDALLAEGHAHDLGHRLLSVVPGVGGALGHDDTGADDAAGPVVDGEWEGV